MIDPNIVLFLINNGVEYRSRPHLHASTTAEIAQMANISGKSMLKPVIVEADGIKAMIVVPSSRTVDLFKLNAFFKSKAVRILAKDEVAELFPGCDVSAMPPLGLLYWISTYVDQSVLDESTVYFNAGTTCEIVEVSMKDYLRVSRGIVGDFSVPGKKLHDQKRECA